MRSTTTAFDNAIAAEHIDGCHLCELGFDSGTLYVTDNGHNVDWGGHTYLGVGAAGHIDVIREVTTKEIVAVKFSLTGAIGANRTLALDENCNGRPAIVRVAVWSNGVIVNDPVVEFQGRLGNLTLSDEPDPQTGEIQSTVSVTAESRSSGSRRPRARRHSSEDHHINHPTDNIHRFMPTLMDKSLPWPRASYFQR